MHNNKISNQIIYKNNLIKKYSLTKRINILYKILNFLQINQAIMKCNIRRGANLYAFEYLKLNLNKYIKLKDVQDYCNIRTKENTGSPLGDPSRAFEILRKEKLPLEWSEIQYKKNKYVKFTPQLKNKICMKIIENNKYKNDSFNKSIIKEKLRLCNYACSITCIPHENSFLSADHFIPKEKGGLSNYNNCIIINKILNEKKNKKLPIEWFCETILNNFLIICKNVGILEECKLIKFINNY